MYNLVMRPIAQIIFASFLVCFSCTTPEGNRTEEVPLVGTAQPGIPPSAPSAPAAVGKTGISAGGQPGTLPSAGSDTTVADERRSEPTWYDIRPLLSWLRPFVRSNLPLVNGMSPWSDLPFYELNIDLDETNRTYILRQTLWYTNTTGEPLDDIVLRIYANVAGTQQAGGHIPVRMIGGRCGDGINCSVDSPNPSAIRVRPARSLEPGQHIRIEVELLGRLQVIDSSRTNLLAQGIEGMAMITAHGGGGDYGLLAVGDGIVSLANFYAVLAERRRGAWVTQNRSTLGDLGSDDLAHVRATLVTREETQVACSGFQIGDSVRRGDGRIEVHLGASMVRDFTILASRDFRIEKKMVSDIEVRSFYLMDDADSARRVLDTAVRALRIFEHRFGKYPYVHLNVVEAPLIGGAGGVEFSGLITVASALYRPLALGQLGGSFALTVRGKGGIGSLQSTFDRILEFVTAHEVAHQYWRGLVGSNSRLHPFNDEGLAQFSAVLYLQDRYGKERAEDEMRTQLTLGYQMMRMMGQPDGTVDRPVSSFHIPIAYAGLVYGKGPHVYQALRREAGDAVFFAALREYVERYRFQTAPNRAFIAMLAERHRGAEAIAARWLDQRHGDADLGQADLGQIMGTLTGQNHALLGEHLGFGRSGNTGASDEAINIPPELGELLKELETLSPSKDETLSPADLRQLQEALGLPSPAE